MLSLYLLIKHLKFTYQQKFVKIYLKIILSLKFIKKYIEVVKVEHIIQDFP